eukprot:gene13971-17078_t
MWGAYRASAIWALGTDVRWHTDTQALLPEERGETRRAACGFRTVHRTLAHERRRGRTAPRSDYAMSVHTEADSFRGLDIAGYVNKVRKLYQGGQTTEHSFRPALAELFSSINPAITVINEPKRKTDVGAPDFVFMRKDVAAGWCEAKDLGKDVRRFA